MREKQLKLVVTFHTTEEAIIMEQECKAAGLEGRLIPVPRQLSAGCGLAWSMSAELKERVERHMQSKKLGYESMAECMI